MKPIEFPQYNTWLQAPLNVEGQANEKTSNLPIFTDGKVCVSCWELTDEEVTDLIKTRKLYVLLYSGCFHPPIAMSTEPPFVSDKET